MLLLNNMKQGAKGGKTSGENWRKKEVEKLDRIITKMIINSNNDYQLEIARELAEYIVKNYYKRPKKLRLK